MRLSGKEIATLITSIPESGMGITDDIQDWGLKTREDNNPDKPRNQKITRDHEIRLNSPWFK